MDIDFYNKRKVEEIDYKVNKFKNIYEYKYEYILGASDPFQLI